MNELDTIKTFNIKEWYKMVALLSVSFEDYRQKASNGLALLCMGMGKVPDGAGYDNFIKAWERRKDMNELEQMNMEIVSASSLQVAEADLDDAIRYLQECRERLEKAMANLNELRYHIEEREI